MTSRAHLIDLAPWVVADAARRTIESHETGRAVLCRGCRTALSLEECGQLAWARRQIADSDSDMAVAGSTVRR